MQSISLKPSVVLASLGLIVGLAVCDVFLLVHSLHQSTIITGFADKQAAMIPSPGATLPLIKGVALDGKEFGGLPAHTPRFALLVFRETCSFCEANWKNWDRLFEQGGVDVPVVLLTVDKTISQSYAHNHPMIKHRFLIAGVDPSTLASLKLDLTPQTIYVTGGKISHDWPGVLTNDDIIDIQRDMRQE